MQWYSCTNALCICVSDSLYTGAAIMPTFFERHCLSKKQRRCDIVIRLRERSSLLKCLLQGKSTVATKYVDFVILLYLNSILSIKMFVCCCNLVIRFLYHNILCYVYAQSFRRCSILLR